MKRYGYVRVSSREQNISRQLESLMKVGVEKENIFIDKQSGKDFNRNGYQRLLKKLKEGDEVYVKSIDRLGRDYDEIIEQWRMLTRVKNIDIVVIDFPLLDTRKKENELGITGKFIADLVLQILSYVAQVERENTKQRQAEGIKIAKENGVKFGRPAIEKPVNFKEVFALWQLNVISKREAARRLGVNHSTFSRWIKTEIHA